jgi:hypothetical protein
MVLIDCFQIKKAQPEPRLPNQNQNVTTMELKLLQSGKDTIEGLSHF